MKPTDLRAFEMELTAVFEKYEVSTYTVTCMAEVGSDVTGQRFTRVEELLGAPRARISQVLFENVVEGLFDQAAKCSGLDPATVVDVLRGMARRVGHRVAVERAGATGPRGLVHGTLMAEPGDA